MVKKNSIKIYLSKVFCNISFIIKLIILISKEDLELKKNEFLKIQRKRDDLNKILNEEL